ncbi:hypothetical protein Tcan_17224 [Toxocara canis]|uniref:Uncharacterized protein n=1 Tax=Toxocara canis TaxID=6265 RepID=A0A0B2UYS2_TOXCA|nr:hypothetical protein Tcan_17224 [Toxocara canis]
MAFERVVSPSVSAQESVTSLPISTEVCNGNTVPNGGIVCAVEPIAAIVMHQSRENIELVLQEVCIQHRSAETMRREAVKISPHNSDESKKLLASDSETVKGEKPIIIEPLKTR